MYILLPLLLLAVPEVTPSASNELCQEIRAVLEEGVADGYINKQEAAEMLSRCAGRPK